MHEATDITGLIPRRGSVAVHVGSIVIGGGAPVVVQSMTNTDTADVESTVAQTAALAEAGSELVRITVDRDEAAAAVPHIRDALDARGIDVPLVGDFHYIGHKLLTEHPACAQALQLFAAIYGAEAGNLALQCVAVGGGFIGGGIAPKILPALQSGRFMEAFTDKGRFSGMLEGLEVSVALDPQTPLRGAALIASQL